MEITAVRSSRLRLPSPVGRTSASIVQLPTENARLSEFFALMKPRVMLLAVFTALVGFLTAPTHPDPLLGFIGDARFVLLGEASHGTHEFYRTRAEITKRLIEEKGFAAVAVEADWPDAYRINRYVRGASDDGEAVDALGDFERFPGDRDPLRKTPDNWPK